jgi:hypothetical protein
MSTALLKMLFQQLNLDENALATTFNRLDNLLNNFERLTNEINRLSSSVGLLENHFIGQLTDDEIRALFYDFIENRTGKRLLDIHNDIAGGVNSAHLLALNGGEAANGH